MKRPLSLDAGASLPRTQFETAVRAHKMLGSCLMVMCFRGRCPGCRHRAWPPLRICRGGGRESWPGMGAAHSCGGSTCGGSVASMACLLSPVRRLPTKMLYRFATAGNDCVAAILFYFPVPKQNVTYISAEGNILKFQEDICTAYHLRHCCSSQHKHC